MKKLILILALAAGFQASAQDKIGQQQYILCGACHGQAGEGTAAAPPLAGSEWVNGPAENLIRIQLRGLTGPITVKGVEFNSPAGMMALAYQTDEQIAAVLTHIRSSFGNSAPAVTPAQVAALRGEVGKPPMTQADLIPVAGTAAKQPPISNKYANLKTESGPPKWIAISGTVILVILAYALLKKNRRTRRR